MAGSTVSLQKQGNISIITLDDGKANVFSLDMSQALSAALDEIDTQEGAVVIEGREGMYSGGFDLRVIQSDDPDAGRKMAISGVQAALKAFDFPRPIVAAVSGHAVAMGAIFNMGIDWRIGARGNFKHGLSEVRSGLTLPVFAIELPRFRLNPRMYQEAALQSRIYSPEEAVEAGFLDELADAGALHDRAIQKAEELAFLPNPAYAASKKRDRGPTKKFILDTLESDFEALRAETNLL